MRKIYFLLIGFSFFISLTVHSQTPNFEWSESIGGSYIDEANCIAVDNSNNIYVIGKFNNTLDFDPSLSIYNLNGYIYLSDIFIQKLDSNRNLLWAKRIGSIYNDAAESITIDNNDNIYITGFFHDTVDFDPGPNVFNLNTTHGGDEHPESFVLKLNSNGDFIWATHNANVSSSTSLNRGKNIQYDQLGYIYVAGELTGGADFNTGSSSLTLISNGDYDNYIQKLDTNGNFIWAKSYGGSSWNYIDDIDVDSYGNIYSIGVFKDSTDFDPGAGVYIIPNNYNSHLFIQKLDINGEFIWAKSYSDNTFNSQGYEGSIVLDQFDNIYIAGSYWGAIDFDPGPGVFNMTAQGINMDLFIVKFNPSGDFIWAKTVAGNKFIKCYSMSIDDSSSIYLTGSFSQTSDFDTGINTYNLTSTGVLDTYILKLDSSGDFMWVKQLACSNRSQGNSITVYNSSDVYVTGIYRDTISLNPSLSPNISSGYEDFFAVKYNQENFSTSVKEHTKLNLNVYPNPTLDLIHIERVETTSLKIELLDYTGKNITAFTSNKQKISINLSKYPKGIYFIKITDSKTSIIKKVIKI